MAQKRYPMTADGKKKLQDELRNLKLVKRPEVIERIKVARSFGDLSENSEYDSAKDEQSAVESRIQQVEEMLKYADVIDADSVDPNEVSIGKTVTYTEVGTNDPETYTIVGSDESDPLNGKISNNSPIAKALLGKKTGDKVTISTPGGQFDVEINKVSVED
jgi:transcription elongation factor GreA